MPKFSIIILTYNSVSFISNFFDSLFSKLGAPDEKVNYEVIVFDNASIDDTPRNIKDYFLNKNVDFDIIAEDKVFMKKVRIHESSKNLGYARGVNSAVKFARGEYILIINPDSIIENIDTKKIHEEFKSNNKLAIAGFNISDFSGQNEKNAGLFFNNLTLLMYILGLEKISNLRSSYEHTTEVDYVSGGFIIFRKQYFELLNGYDEDYFMYIEDMDICFRAKKMGYKTFFLPYAKIKHKGQGSSNREFAIVNIFKGLCIFYSKHGSIIQLAYVKNLLRIKATLIIFVATVLGKKNQRPTYFKALKSIS